MLVLSHSSSVGRWSFGKQEADANFTLLMLTGHSPGQWQEMGQMTFGL